MDNIHTTPGRAKGKLPPTNRKSVSFGDFLTVLPTVPLVDIAPTFIYPMDLNDSIGCCVVAGFDHFRQVVTGLLCGKQANFTQDEIINFYKTQNPHFDLHGSASTNGPGSSSDNGMNIQLFLEYLVSQKKILGFAKIDHTNEEQMKAAIYMGLGIIIGVIVTEPQMNEQFYNKLWDWVPDAKQDGGHCVTLAGYINQPDKSTCITWGTLIDCTQSFISHQADEAWFVLMQEHVDHPSFRNHFDLAGFSEAVKNITEGKVIIPYEVISNPKWKYFSLNEKTGLNHTIADLVTTFVDKMDIGRGFSGIPWIITSGYRTIQENINVGGVSGSTHILRVGADILADTDSKKFAIVSGAIKAGFNRIGIYDSHIHIDSGPYPSFPQNVLWSIAKD